MPDDDPGTLLTMADDLLALRSDSRAALLFVALRGDF